MPFRRGGFLFRRRPGAAAMFRVSIEGRLSRAAVKIEVNLKTTEGEPLIPASRISPKEWPQERARGANDFLTADGADLADESNRTVTIRAIRSLENLTSRVDGETNFPLGFSRLEG